MMTETPHTPESGAPEQDALELRVLAGLHTGAALPLGNETVVLGSDEACDVILLDSGVLPVHVRFVPLDGKWLIEPEGSAVVFDLHGQAVAAHAIVRIGEPLRMGQAWVALCDSFAPWEDMLMPPRAKAAPRLPVPTRNKPPGRLMWPLAALGFIVMLLALLVWWIPSPEQIDTRSLPVRPIPKTKAPTDAESIRHEATRVLRERELAELVNVVSTPGQLYLDAQLDDAETRRFESALVALNRSFGGNVKINAKLTPLTSTLPFVVKEVVTGPAAHITLGNGKIVYEGGMAAGYRLVAIRPGKLLFAGTRRIELPW